MKNGPPERLNWAQSRLIRITQGGPKGAQASIIGFVLVGPIIGGFLIGNWLDGRMQTQFWTPLLGLLGVFSGFREMFVTLKRLQPKPGEKSLPPGRSEPLSRNESAQQQLPRGATTVDDSVEETPRQRLFSVPPPPFMEQSGHENQVQPTSEEVRNRLLGNDEDEAKS